MKVIRNTLFGLTSGVAAGGLMYGIERYLPLRPVEQNAQARQCAKYGLQAVASETTVVPVPCQDFTFDHKEVEVFRYDAATDSTKQVSDTTTYLMPSAKGFLKVNISTPEQIRQRKRANRELVELGGIGFGALGLALASYGEFAENRRKKFAEEFGDDDDDSYEEYSEDESEYDAPR